MRRVRQFPLPVAVGLAVLCAEPTRGQVAPPAPTSTARERLIRPGVSPRAGRLAGDPGKGLRFEGVGGEPSVALGVGAVVEFRPSWRAPAAGAPPFRLDLGMGQQLFGSLRSIDENAILLVDVVSTKPLRIGRGSVQAVAQTPGETLVVADGFEDLDASRWQKVGAAAAARDKPLSGETSLRLPAGASLAHRLREPVPKGRLEVAFHDDGRIDPGTRSSVALVFRGASGLETVKAVLGRAEESLSVESTGGPALAVQRLARGPGWHRLVLRFAPDLFEASVDGNELAHGRGPGGPLVEVRIASDEPVKGASTGPPAYFDDVRVTRGTDAIGTPEIDASQDEIRFNTGDQVFGNVSSATLAVVSATIDGRVTTFPWSDVSSLHFQRVGKPGVVVSGWIVRAEWLATSGSDDPSARNRMEGALTAVTPDLIRLSTPYCGELEIGRDRLTRLEVISQGARLVLDSFAHHLGDEISTMPPVLDPPEPEGGALERSFELDRVPAGAAWLVLDLVQVVSESPDASVDPRFAMLVKKGELRTNVALNGTPFDYLNHYIHTRNETPERVRIPLPKGSLRRGRNTVRLEQVGIASDPNYLDDLGVVGVAIEWETPG